MLSIDRQKLLRYSLIGAGAAVLLGGLLLLGGYFFVARSLPRVDTLADYRPPIITRVYSDDGTVIAEYYEERRIVVPVDKLPQQLVQAFVSAEDSNFFHHSGIDLTSIARAALKNVLAGGIVQGGSTITQQVAKSLLLTPEKKFSRKFKEAILARRMEKSLTKDEILYLYLNQIFLGHGAYGVQAAAENYFDKNVEQLTLAECAMLAGLPQAPSRYSPYLHYERAKERQKYVLGRMIEEGYITREQADVAAAEQVTIHARVNQHITGSAYFAEQVRRYLEENYGRELLLHGGLQVQTSMNLSMQQAAQEAVRNNLRDHDKRTRYRGPKKVLSAEEEAKFLAEQQQALRRQLLLPGTIVDAVVVSGNSRTVQVRIGEQKGEILIDSAAWATPLIVTARGSEPAGNATSRTTRLPVGSLIEVRVAEIRPGAPLRLTLEQEPLAQSALIAIEPVSGQVKAMVGGYDFGKSQFNRALQARRLPGSAFKPIIYAAALDKGYTPATVILDTPLIYKELNSAGEETEWKPKNYAEKFYGPVPMRSALAHSHNVITIKILEDVGVNYVAEYAARLGINSPLTRDLTLALGSSAVTPMELTSAYCVFASGGMRNNPVYITRIADRDGQILESLNPADFPNGPQPGQRLIQQTSEQVISPETAYLITNMMESVVQNGTGQRARALERPAAGKTGTTNDLKDAWFAGFVPQLAAVVWIGYDQERPLGPAETGAQAAAPAWVAFMQKALRGMPPQEFAIPETIEFHPIDAETGLLAGEDAAEPNIEVFAPGTAPSRSASEEKKPKGRDFFRLDVEDQ